MSNIETYLKWRGDLTWKESAFCEVDALILCEISYVNMKGLLPEASSKEGRNISQVSKAFFATYSVKALEEDSSFIREAPFLMKQAAATKRFQDVMIYHYVDYIDEETDTQFAAMMFQIGKRDFYVAFRGTDNTLIGWKEDFQMSYRIVPAQRQALEYMNCYAGKWFTRYRLGGHSKGGNLAIYAGAFSKEKIQKKIIEIDNFDGPGFLEEVLEEDGYQRILSRIHSYIPQFSVVGLLMKRKDIPMVIISKNKGTMQHDAMSWQVGPHGFVQGGVLKEESKSLDEVITLWLSKLSEEEREMVVNDLFGVLEEMGAKTVTDLQKIGIPKLAIALKAFGNMDESTKQVVRKFIEVLGEERKKEGLFTRWIKDREEGFLLK